MVIFHSFLLTFTRGYSTPALTVPDPKVPEKNRAKSQVPAHHCPVASKKVAVKKFLVSPSGDDWTEDGGK